MNKSIVTYNRFILNSESHSITTEDHADILHGYLKGFQVCYILSLQRSPKMRYCLSL
jgi:hypothetical protein